VWARTAPQETSLPLNDSSGKPKRPAARLFGCSAVRLFGCSAVRLFGCSAVRLFGCSESPLLNRREAQETEARALARFNF
jgi:hypothetical protein